MAVWRKTVDAKGILHNDDLTLEQKRDELVARIRGSLGAEIEGDLDLDSIVEELSDVDSVEYMDAVWSGFYDWCDANRVWVATV